MEKNIRCQKCGKDILQLNYTIHQARCRGDKQTFNFGLKPNVQSKKRSIFKPQIKQKVQQSSIQNQKFPCSQCGYLMRITQFESHEKQCVNQLKKCKYCSQEFPQQLIQEHFLVCQKKKQNNQNPRNQNLYEPDYQNYQFDDEQINDQEYEQQIPHQEIHQEEEDIGSPIQTMISQQQINGRSRKVEKLVYRNGLVIQKTYEGNNLISQRRYHNQAGNIHNNNVNIFSPIPGVFNISRSRQGMDQFHMMIQQLMSQMHVNRNQNPGLSRQQIKKVLKKVKYNKNTNGKQCVNCTICVTDFTQGMPVVQLPCGHMFNEQCIIPWVKTSSVCPNCRKPLSQRRNLDSDEEF